MTMLRTSLIALGVAAALSLPGVVQSQSQPQPRAAPTADQQKEIDAARADLDRAAKRLAELSGRYGGHGFQFDRTSLAKRPVIGVLLAPEAQGGVRIAGVTPDGPAARAGVKTGDRLLRIGGKTIGGETPEARVAAARELLGAGDDKTAMRLVYARDGRESEVTVTPKLDERIMLFSNDGQMMRPGGNVVVRRVGDGEPMLDLRGLDIDFELPHGGQWQGTPGEHGVFMFKAGPDDGAHGESRVIRIECKDKDEACKKKAAEHMAMAGADGSPRRIVMRTECKPGEDCKDRVRLAEAFRWNGLNLASVDAQLGRYFGTDKGVLVLSAGPALDALQPGDVIQRVDGKAVDTPRAVMDALRDKPADSDIAVEYLRDRKAGTTRVKVPKAMPFPQMPPVSPIAPKAGAGTSEPAAAVVTRRSVVMVDKDGQVSRWEDDGSGPVTMLPAPAMPPAPLPPPRVD